MPRRRRYISLREKLAAALACLLSQAERDELRSRKAPARAVLSLFEWHHVVMHALDGSDAWHNLDPMLAHAHRERSKRDTSDVYKTRRIEPRWNEFTRALASGRKPPRKPSRWPKRKVRKWAK